MNLVEFWQQVTRKAPDDCWPWDRNIDRYGYGRVSLSGRSTKAHRAAYAAAIGPIEMGLEVDHACHTRDLNCAGGVNCPHRRCVNPAHLELVTHRVNSLRGRGPVSINAAKTKCDNGHPFDSANTYIRPIGSRDCRACIRDRVRRYKSRKRVSA